jgi:hypothetical protein
MSFQLMAWASEQRTGSPTRKAVLMALSNAANHQTGRCDPRIESICEETEFGATAVKTALKELAEQGLIKRERKRRGDGSLSTYSFSFPRYQESRGDQPETAGDSRPEPPGDSQNQEVPNQETVDPPPRAPLAEVVRIGAVDRKRVTEDERDLAVTILDRWNEIAGQHLRSSEWLRKIVMRIREHPELGALEHDRIIAAALRPGNRWWKGEASPSVVYGNGALFEKCVMQAANGSTAASQEAFDIALAEIERARQTS